MKNIPKLVKAGAISVEYDVADFTEPWASEEPEVVLMHAGFCRNMNFWRPWVPELASRYRVLRINSRGCGATETGAENEAYNTDVLVADALNVLDALEIDKVHWVGESTGGLFGMRAAMLAPDRISSIVLVNTPLKVSDAAVNKYGSGEGDPIAAIHKYGVKEFCRRTLGMRLDLRHAPQAMQDWYVEEIGKVPLRIAAEHLRLTFETNLLDSVKSLDTPILNIYGTNSAVSEKSQMELMKSILPNMELIEVENYGHAVNLLLPSFCVAKTLAFLSRLGRASDVPTARP